MIVFDLRCADAGHVFEAWFGASGDFEDQRDAGLLACPICGSERIEKAVMAPAVAVKGNRNQEGRASVPMAHGHDERAESPAKMKQLLSDLAKHQAKMLESSDYVGRDFADEARSMHAGEQDHRSIHGETSADEAKSLIEDGVPVAPLPLPVRPPKTDN